MIKITDKTHTCRDCHKDVNVEWLNDFLVCKLCGGKNMVKMIEVSKELMEDYDSRV